MGTLPWRTHYHGLGTQNKEKGRKPWEEMHGASPQADPQPGWAQELRVPVPQQLPLVFSWW